MQKNDILFIKTKINLALSKFKPQLDLSDHRTKNNTFSFTITNQYLLIYKHIHDKDTIFKVTKNILNISFTNYELLLVIQVVNSSGKYQLRVLNSEKIESLSHFYCQESQLLVQNKPFLAVNCLKNRKYEEIGFELKSGQILKMGNALFEVKQVPQLQSQTKHPKILTYQPYSSEKVCFICEQLESPFQNDFMFAPCKCKDKFQYVHFKCLQKQQQISSIIIQDLGIVTTYNFSPHFCSHCSEEYPNVVKKDNKDHPIDKLKRPKGKHITLQNMHNRNEVTIIEKIPEQGILIGRNMTCQIRNTEKGVQPQHALIKQIDNQWRIFQNSDYGPLVYSPDLSIQLNEHIIVILVGHTTIYLQYEKHFQ